MANFNKSLTSFAAIISETTTAPASVLETNNYPPPSFAEDGPLEYLKISEVAGLRSKLLDPVSDLYRLSMGRGDMAFVHPLHFNFWDAVPLGGSATIPEVAKNTTLPESLVRRLLAYSIPTCTFAHGPPGFHAIVHTSLSACFVKKPLYRAWLHHSFEDMHPAVVHTPESSRKNSANRDKECEEPLESGFALADHDRLGRPTGAWEYMRREVEGRSKGFRAQNFAKAMQVVASISPLSSEDVLRTGHDWASLGEATVVDIGGTSSHDAIVIATALPELKLIVQDLPEVETTFRRTVPVALASRIEFEARDFFGAQNTKADVYMLKLILHDWSDKYVVKILTPLLAHLKSGSRLLLCESVVPPSEAPLPATMQRMLASSDLQMPSSCNALERKLSQWKESMQRVDPCLQVTYVSDFPESMYNLSKSSLRARAKVKLVKDWSRNGPWAERALQWSIFSVRIFPTSGF